MFLYVSVCFDPRFEVRFTLLVPIDGEEGEWGSSREPKGPNEPSEEAVQGLCLRWAHNHVVIRWPGAHGHLKTSKKVSKPSIVEDFWKPSRKMMLEILSCFVVVVVDADHPIPRRFL